MDTVGRDNLEEFWRRDKKIWTAPLPLKRGKFILPLNGIYAGFNDAPWYIEQQQKKSHLLEICIFLGLTAQSFQNFLPCYAIFLNFSKRLNQKNIYPMVF